MDAVMEDMAERVRRLGGGGGMSCCSCVWLEAKGWWCRLWECAALTRGERCARWSRRENEGDG